MASESERTDTKPRGERRPRSRDSAPHLVFLFDCESPLRPAEQHRLDVDTVRIGRGPVSGVTRDENSLTLALADRLASQSHAQLERVFGVWVLEDRGSKNGTWLNGAPLLGRAELSDGDLLELGNSFFLFRGAAPGAEPGAAAPFGEGGLRTFHPSLAAQLRRVEALAPSNVSLLIHGETGTGKEVVARMAHERSGRAGPFQAINCAAIPLALLESELFGHKKGAFSGATEDRRGLIAVADGGTLFLDEIGDLPQPAQVALLRVLQESAVHPLGAPRPTKLDLRVIAATHRDLPALVRQDKFRADLLARLSGYTLQLPALRERPEDLGTLVAALLQRQLGEPAARVRFTPEAGRALLRHAWPANVRELEKCLHTAVVLAAGAPIELDHLPDSLAERALETPADESRRDELLALLRTHKGNVTGIAAAMGKARMQVQRWLKRYGLDAATFRE